MRSVLILLMAVMAMATEYRVDKSLSSITFEATKMIFVGVEGNFGEFDGYLLANEGKLSGVDGTVAVASIFTDNEKRDAHLRSPDFFDAERFAQIKVLSETIDEKRVGMKVTIREQSHLIPFTIEKFEIQNHTATLVLQGVVDRTLFGIDSSMMSTIINDNVDVKAVIVAKEMWEDQE